MFVKDLMTLAPRTCTENDSLRDAAEAMAEGDFGSIAVVDPIGHPIGIVTDRDIAIRGIAQGHGPDTSVSQIMTDECCCVSIDDDVEEAVRLMEERQIRRVVAVDEDGCVCGMVATKDIAEKTDREHAGEVLQEVSKSNRNR